MTPDRPHVTDHEPEEDQAHGPIRLAVRDDYEIVVAGITSMMAPYDDRVKVVGLGDETPTDRTVDVVLYDTVAALERAVGRVAALTGDEATPRPRLVVFSWNLDPVLVRQALTAGAAGYLSKGLGSADLVSAVERVHAGEVVTAGSAEPGTARSRGRWPGQEAGLSARESETVALITQGLSNREIAERSFLSINSVKTYIRSAYRKMGVERRSQAVLWGLRHGFDPEARQLPADSGVDGDDHADLTRRAPGTPA